MGPAQLLLNTQDGANGWIGFRLTDASGATLAGARLGVTCGDRTRWRRARREGSYASSNDPRVIVGLGADAPSRCDVEVIWDGGQRERYTGLRTGRYNDLQRGGGE